MPADGAAGALVARPRRRRWRRGRRLCRRAEAAGAAGFTVALVEQPYRVAGRKSPAPARQLDAAWEAVVAELRDAACSATPLVAGGRSLGARVACRTAARPAPTPSSASPSRSTRRARATTRPRPPGRARRGRGPVLVVQGESDPFGMPAGGPDREVVTVAGNHGLKADARGDRRGVSTRTATSTELVTARDADAGGCDHAGQIQNHGRDCGREDDAGYRAAFIGERSQCARASTALPIRCSRSNSRPMDARYEPRSPGASLTRLRLARTPARARRSSRP